MMGLDASPADQRVRDTAVRGTGLPFSAVLGFFAGLAVFSVSLHEIRDIDLYWHLLAGAQLSSGQPADSLGQDWTFGPNPNPWTSTQWLSEIVLYRLHEMAGWIGLAALRVITAAVAIAVLSWTTLRSRPKALAGFPFLLATGAVAVASQERPQQATLMGAAILGGTLISGITEGRLPRWYVLLPATIIWANFHGGWVLVPVVMGLIAVGRLADHGPRDPLGWRAAVLMLATLVCGAITPAGLAGLSAPFRFQGAAAGLIQEWQGTTPVDRYGVLTILMLALICVAWSRPTRVPRSELVGFFACLVFAWTAWRNVAPGLALVAPLVAHSLTRAFPRRRVAEPRWSVPVGIGAAVVLSLLSLVSLAGRDHLPRSTQPIALAEQISQLGPGQRVLNDYNAAGVVLYFGGDDVQVGIDGRTDRYGKEYIDDYVGLRSLEGDWQALLDELAPTAALFEEDRAIVHVLQTERGWQVVGRQDGWVLLVPGP